MFDTCSFKPTNDGFPPSSGGGGGAVTSVFGRTGVVIAVAGDYTSSEITNSSTVTGTYVTDALNTLDTGKLSTTLTNGNIIVGNGSNVATAVAMSGDATIINTGALTISNQAVTFSKMQHISSQHLVGRHAAGTGDIQQISLGTGLSFSGANLQVTGFVPTTLTSANIIVGNNLGVATAVAMSGDTTINNTGAVTISNDAVTTAKILNSNVTYAKIQNVAATRLLGNSTGSPAAPEEITLGTNLSFTGTTLNAAGGGGYTYLAITLSVPNTIYNKAALAGANYLFISTNDATTRTITINSTGFVANDFLVLSFNEASLGSITLIIGTTPRTFATNRGNSILAVYDGLNWILNSLANSYTTANSSTDIGMAIGLGTGIKKSGSNLVLAIGNNTYLNTNNAIYIGHNINSGNGNGISIGHNLTATNDTVAIGQSITATGFDGSVLLGNSILTASIFSVLIGNGVSGGSNNVTIGNGATGTGTNCVRIGRSVLTGTSTGVVAIGQGITTTNTDAVVIGRGASAGGAANVTIGAASTGTGANCVRIGNTAVTNNATTSVAIGQGATIGTGGANVVAIGQGVNTGTSVASIAIGQGATIGNGGTNNIAIGAGVNTSTNNNTIAIGTSITTTGSNALILGISAQGGATTTVIGNSAIGTGANTTVIGYQSTATTATSNVLVGHAITATGNNTIAIGAGVNTGTNTGVVAIGQGITTTSTDAVIIGKGASGGNIRGVSIGAFTNIVRNNSVRFRLDNSTSISDTTYPSHSLEFIGLMATTNNNTPTEMFVGNDGVSKITLQANNQLAFTGSCQAYKSTQDASAKWDFSGMIRRDGANNTSIVGTTVLTMVQSDGVGSGLILDITADDTTENLKFTARGNTGETWYWFADVKLNDLKIA